MEALKFYNASKIISHNGIYNFVISNRNYGKTWAFKIRAWRRAVKHGKKTLWLRTFSKELKQASNGFYSSKDLQKKCGIIPYDKTTKKGNFKQIGNTCYCKRGNRWVWFLKLATVNDANAIRGADDVDTDTIVYDEYRATPQRLARYRGNIVTDFVDIFISTKRMHAVRCFFLGNKEIHNDPFFSYFNIKPLPSSFEGIKHYRKNSLIVQQINNLPIQNNEYEKKVNDLLQGTAYGNYLYKSTYKDERAIKIAKTPTTAVEYVQLNIKGYEVKISVYNGFFYCNNKIDIKRRVYCLVNEGKYKQEYLLVKRQKRFFIGLINAIADNRLYYDTHATYEALQAFYIWLGI